MAEPRDHRGWIDDISGVMRCPNCGAAYDRDDVTEVGARDVYRHLRCTCRFCGSQDGVVIAVEATPTLTERPPFTADDVLDAHDLLRDYRGDANGLFAAGPLAAS